LNAPIPIKRHAIAPLLSGGFILLALIVTMPVLFGARERAHTAVAQRALQAETQLSDLFSTMRQSENGSRGYLITGNPISLNTYDMALAQAPREEHALDAAVGPGDAPALSEVHRLVAEKLAELARIMSLLKAGDKAEATARITADLNLGTMVELRALTARMSADEAAEVARAQAGEAHDAQRLQIATALAVLGTLLLAGIVMREQREQTGRLRAAEADLIAANAALEQKVTELDRIFNLSTDILTVGGFDGRLSSVSPAWERITGRPVAVALSRPYLEFVHPDDRAATEAVGDALLKGQSIALQNRYLRADGSYCWLSWRAVAELDQQLIYGVARDITAEREREERLRQSQKMEVIGQLTGGVAHDFNNLLTIIMGSLELVQRSLNAAEPRMVRRIETAMEAARRAAALTHRLLAFSRQQPWPPRRLMRTSCWPACPTCWRGPSARRSRLNLSAALVCGRRWPMRTSLKMPSLTSRSTRGTRCRRAVVSRSRRRIPISTKAIARRALTCRPDNTCRSR
jgi:PAS domain S-box-containing protein